MRIVLTLIVMCCTAALIAPAAAKKNSKLESVEAPVEDKAGWDAEQELDFKRLTAEVTAESVKLTLETWTAWDALEEPDHAQVSVVVAKPNHRDFYDASFRVRYDGGTLSTSVGAPEGTSVDEGSSSAWMPAEGSWQAELDGTVLTVTIPWAQLPEGEPWIQVWSMHTKEIEDEETGETRSEYKRGSSSGVPNDDVPNKGKAVVIHRPV